MKKTLSLIFLFFLLNISLFSQKQKDALYLKDGSIIYGHLQEIASDTYSMRMYDGSIVVYPASEVEKYTTLKNADVFYGRKKNGLGFALESGLLIGSQDSRYKAPFSFCFLAGYTGMTKNIVSIGSGVEFIGRPFTPVFFEYRYIVNENKTSPFLFFRLGGVISLGDREDIPNNQNYNYYVPMDYEGGLSGGFGSGISWIKEDYEMYLSFAYRYARTSYKQIEGQYKTVTYENNLNRLEIKLGFRF